MLATLPDDLQRAAWTATQARVLPTIT
jgi:hypothetical protein